MKRLFYLFAIAFFPLPAFSHPGIGLVKDSKGNLYYTDLKHVWKINKGGKKTIAVKDVHTHELYMDSGDNLYGEHSWYNGERLNTWGHYTWRLSPQGKLDTIIKPTAGFIENYSFARDGAGNMYWVQKFKTKRFKMKTVSGEIKTIAEGKFKDVRWMYVTHEGIIYFVDLMDLYKFSNGKFSVVARSLHERTSLYDYASLKHSVYGIWPDKRGNIYVAILGGQVVKKITSDGKVSSVFYSSGDWKPCTGIFDDNGNMWIMEVNTANEITVRNTGMVK